ncbi:NUDIX domain-containing protein [Sorangium sp. So ce117]|uniref:NUDIX domain-containing protein n=1 Tax=Sorangium sp. So ce117 TaxID=3133277 RepID=UPI003F5E7C18
MDERFHTSSKAVVVRDDHILLIQYRDVPRGEAGHHYNLPGGRVCPNERLTDAVVRKLKEEAGADAVAGPLLFVYEYIGRNHASEAGDKHSISLIFRCELLPGSAEPSMSTCTMPDSIQTGVEWVPLSRLEEILLFPKINRRLLDLLRNPPPAADPYWGDIL